MNAGRRAILVLGVLVCAGLLFVSPKAQSQSQSRYPVCLVGDEAYSSGAQVKIKGGRVRCDSGIWTRIQD
jgi:hypothetical protein